LITPDPQIAKQARILKDHGQSQQYQHHVQGLNSRMDALQAAILSVKLPHLPEWNWRRRGLAESYASLLAGIPDLIVPQQIAGGSSVWHQYTVRILGDEREQPNRRDRVQQALKDLGIASRIYYPIPLHLQPVYQALGYQVGDYPMAELCAQQVLSLPFFPELTAHQQEQVAIGLKQAMQTTAVVNNRSF
jgi:dTDP-4-amino-4,6-dideoxygalactose transaminase